MIFLTYGTQIHSSSAITGQQSIGNIFYRFLFTFIIVSALTLQEPSLSVSSTSLLPRPPTQNVNSNFGSPPQLGGGVFGFGSPPHLGISAIQTHQPSSSLLNRGFSGGHNSIFSNNDTGSNDFATLARNNNPPVNYGSDDGIGNLTGMFQRIGDTESFNISGSQFTNYRR
jgi:hypothetical protein